MPEPTGPIVLRNPDTGEVITVPSEASVPFFPSHTERVTGKEAAAVLAAEPPAEPRKTAKS